MCVVNHTGPGGFTHLFTAMSSGIENTHQLISHTYLANCTLRHLGCPTPSHARAHTFAPAAHTLFTRRAHIHTGGPTQLHAQSAAPYHSRHTLGLGTRAASTRPSLARALARALTPPRFPSLLIFLLSFKTNLDICFQFIIIFAIMWTYFMLILYDFCSCLSF